MPVSRGPSSCANKQRGVALAMLLWMLAALTLLVSGVVFQSRTDVQLTRLHLDQARAQAAAQGGVGGCIVAQVGVLGAVDAGRRTRRGPADSVDPSAVDVAIGVRPHNRIGPRVGSLGCIPQRKSTQRVAVGGCCGSCGISRAGA